ncbi:MAG: hypothetical protein Roseis2KO_02670 [Roseivirga sp.]
MNQHKDHSYSLTRGLGGLFIFASLQFLENNLFVSTLRLLVIGVLNMLPYPWTKRWSSIATYGIDAITAAVVFYEFIQLDFKYIQWMWLAVFVYYVIRLRDLFRKEENDSPIQDEAINQEETA